MSNLRIVTIPMQTGFDLGLGIEPITGQSFQPLATNLPLNEKTSFVEKRDYSLLSSVDEYSKVVDSVIHGSVSGIGWSVSADVEYLNSSSISDTSLSFVISSRVTTKTSELDDEQSKGVKIDPAALELLAQDVERFQELYGTHFVAGFIYGGSFLGQVNINTHTSKQKESLKAAMHASISSFLSGGLDASFQKDLNNYRSDYSVKASGAVDGAAETYEVGNIASMQAALNSFAGDLKNSKSEGRQLTAICYSWDRLPAIRDALKGREFRFVDSGVVEQLTEEVRKLDYLKANVTNMIDNKCYVGSTQKNKLDSLKHGIGKAREKVQNLSLKELLNLNTDDVEKHYQVADQIEDELDTIAQGHCTLNWQVSLDGAFDPVNQETRTLTDVRPSSNVVIVERARHHKNDTDWELGYFYGYVDADGKFNSNGKPKLKAYMNELNNGEKADNGWIEPNTGETATAQWTGADWNKVTVSFQD